MLNVLLVFVIGGGAILNEEYGLFCCCCCGGGAIEKLDRPLDVLEDVLPQGLELMDGVDDWPQFMLELCDVGVW